MAQRKNKERKSNLQNFKNNHKMERQQNEQTPELAPNVFQQPTWRNDAKIDVTGAEFEAIMRAVDQMGQASAALQNIVNRNLLQGTITMTYFKVDETGTAYTPLTEEESAPYRQTLQDVIAQANAIAAQAVADAENGAAGEKGVPPAKRLDAIVNQFGEPFENQNGNGNNLKVVE